MGSLEGERSIAGWAVRDPSGVLSPYTYSLRETGPEDVYIKVLYCGICHTDIHQAKNHVGRSTYPMVPGHEVIGEVVEAGADAADFRAGDIVGVGGLVGCCGDCRSCNSSEEQYCNKKIWSYNDKYLDGKPTYGGLASHMVVYKKFVVKIPEGLPAEQAAPLLCAGVTAYSILKYLGGLDKPGLRGAVLGLGGVGHMAVKLAKAMGHHVTVISSSEKKKEEAIHDLGADEFLVAADAAQSPAAFDSLDYIIDTVPVHHELLPSLLLLRSNGKLILTAGFIPSPMQFFPGLLTLGRKSICGSLMGSMEETKEMLKFCEEKGIASTVEVVKMEGVNSAFERLEKGDAPYRFVVDVAGGH